MVNRSVLWLVLSCLGPGFAAGGVAGQADIKARESGAQDTANVAALVHRGSATATITGRLDASSPTFDRRVAGSPAMPATACDGVADDSASNGVPYAAFQIDVGGTAPVAVEAAVVAGGTTLPDSVLYLYCDPFDAQDPGANLIFSDDDDGAGPTGQLSAFTTADGVMLDPGQTYWLVISTFAAAGSEWGNFRIDVSGASLTVVPVEIQSFTVE